MWWARWDGCRRRFVPDGTGEIVYEQMGATRSAIARSEDGAAIPKEEEVFVVRYEKGIAYVQAVGGFAGGSDSGTRDQGHRDYSWMRR